MNKKYLYIRHWDYWFSVYKLYTDSDGTDPTEIEFTITNSTNEDDCFFHLDFYNINGLKKLLESDEYISQGSEDYENFLSMAERLQNKQIDYFIGSIYYKPYYTDLVFCNRESNIFNLKSPKLPPYYAVVFIAEDRALTTDVLTYWVEKLSDKMFNEHFLCEILQIPTKQQTLKAYEQDAPYRLK